MCVLITNGNISTSYSLIICVFSCTLVAHSRANIAVALLFDASVFSFNKNTHISVEPELYELWRMSHKSLCGQISNRRKNTPAVELHLSTVYMDLDIYLNALLFDCLRAIAPIYIFGIFFLFHSFTCQTTVICQRNEKGCKKSVAHKVHIFAHWKNIYG